MDGFAREHSLYCYEIASTYDPGLSYAYPTPGSLLPLSSANGYVENGSDISGYLEPPTPTQAAASVHWAPSLVPTYTGELSTVIPSPQTLDTELVNASDCFASTHSSQEPDASEIPETLESSISSIVDDSTQQFPAYQSPAYSSDPVSLEEGYAAYENDSLRYRESTYLTQNIRYDGSASSSVLRGAYPSNSGYLGDSTGTDFTPDAYYPCSTYASGDIADYLPGANTHPIASSYPSVENSPTNTGAYPAQIEVSLADQAPVSVHTTSPPYRCDECNTNFRSLGEMKRHLKTVKAHKNETTPNYHCFCNKTDTRKTNHQRHVRKCRRPHVTQFICICGRLSSHQDDHVAHIKGCNPKRQRRQFIAS
ncbi:hypothetical protein F5B22DRAFT_470752 [Xylaria bambusicola]|uniref:uncharacterized protein n=1 Tax=Xylaria bambusicola TaxID=326684 RepID=UPI0020080351|nr:uncharacterized protein F5B22DRAFT_470752 [Xylaria bambusicola]KAI0506204.1 hypothetical protein F5B22DRAFT_470752 [Xylaria bambusicola]